MTSNKKSKLKSFTFIRHYLIPMKKYILSLSLLATSAFAEKVVINMADYGLLPNQANSSSVLHEALTKIKASVSPNDEVTLYFDKGIYTFSSTDAKDYEYYISNHDQYPLRKIGFHLDGWKNLTLDGRGAEFLFTGRMIPFYVVNCTNTTLCNFSVDFTDPQITQAEILSNTPEDGTTFEMAPWAKYRIGQNGRFEVFGSDWAMQPNSGMNFEKKTRHIAYQTGDLWVVTDGVQDLGNGKFRAPQWKEAKVKPGTIVTFRTYHRPCPGMVLDHDNQTVLQNVNIHYSEGMGLIAQRCTDITLDGFNVCLRGKNDPRYFTTQADATHFSQCKGHIKSVNGLYEGMMDDAINIHGVYLKVKEVINAQTIRCAYEHGQAYGFAWGDVGDTIRFVSAFTMEEHQETYTILDIKPADKETVKGCKQFIITLNRPMDKTLELATQDYGIENLTWTPTVYFAKNVVRNNRARGALFSSPRHTICEDNLFDHTSGTAILLCGDCNGWYESGSCKDIVIRNNKFVNALTSYYQFTNAVISIYPEIPRLNDQQQYFHSNILIENNKFTTFDEPILYAKSVDGLTFRKNKIKRSKAYAPFHWNKEAFKMERVKGFVKE